MNYFSKFSLLLPLAFFVGAAIQYISIASGQADIVKALYVRDLFIIITLILSLPLIYKQKWASDRNVLRGLRHLFLLILVTGAILFLSDERLGKLRDFYFENSQFSDRLSDNIFVVSWAFFTTVFILIALGTLKNLIYVKRRKNTARNFTWLMIALVMYSLFSLPQSYPESNLEYNNLYNTAGSVLLFLLITLMVVNSFRVGWINYLNKKQKLGCFWGGAVLIPVQIVFTITFFAKNPLVSFSPLLERFTEMGVLFITIYLGVSFLALLGHLPTAKLYDRKMQQIQSLHNLSKTLNSEFDRTALVKTIVKLASEVTESDFTWLELYDPVSGKLALRSSKKLSAVERKNWISHHDESFREYLKETRRPFLCNEVGKNERAAALKSWKPDLNSLVVVPMIASERLIGFLYSGKNIEFGFEHDDAEMLRAFADQAVVAVENARLIEESIVKERLEQELKVAHEAQMKLLPKEMPQLPGFEMDAVCITANDVGGDYYDFFRLGPDKLGVVIGDVAGKGPSAAFYMAEVKGIMEALARETLSPTEMLRTANSILYHNFDRRTFISLVYGVLDATSRQFTFCRAGHCPIYFTGPAEKTVKRLEPKGLGVGLESGALFGTSLEEITISLENGQSFLLFTDGCTEARSPSGNEFGEERLAELLHANRDQTSAETKKRIIHEIFTFLDGEKVYDDLTFIIIKATDET